MLTYEDNVKPYKNVCNAKEMSTDYRSSLHGRLFSSLVFRLCWLVLNLSEAELCSAPRCRTLKPALALCVLLFHISFCFQKAVKERIIEFTTVMLQTLTPIFLSLVKPNV